MEFLSEYIIIIVKQNKKRGIFEISISAHSVQA